MSFSLRTAKILNAFLPFGWQLAHPEVLPLEDQDSALARLEADLARHRSATEQTRTYAYLGPNLALTRLKDGHMIYVDPADAQISPHLIMTGIWEPHIEAVIALNLKPGARVIEVGANLGYYTLIMGRLVGPTGRIDSFEANPRLTALLERTVYTNGYADRVTVHQNVVSDRPGPITFSTSLHEPGGGGIRADGRDWGDATILIEAEAVVLDALYPSDIIDFIRMDAEGSEQLILEGAMNLIARSPGIQICCEWSVAMMSRRGDAGALAKRLDAMGFLFWVIDPAQGLVPIDAAALATMANGDVWMSRTPLS